MFTQMLLKIAYFASKHSSIGKRVARGIHSGKIDKSFVFNEVESNKLGMIDSFVNTAIKNGGQIVSDLINDNHFISSLQRFLQKSGIKDVDIFSMSKEEIIETLLQKSGVGPCKFAQIISSEKSIMSKLTPDLQNIIRKTQSENLFSRTKEEAQEIIDKGFNSVKRITDSSSEFSSYFDELTIIKPLSAGTVGEAYLAKTAEGKEVIVKMIKKGVDSEQLNLEQTLFTKLIQELAPDAQTADKLCGILKNLYKSWSKELNFSSEYEYNKLLQEGAKRFKVADIKFISPDKSFIIMEKAEGIQMNDLMKMLKLYKSNPDKFKQKYADMIKQNPWLENPDRVIEELPECITKSFDEMFMFMKKDGSTLMHGDPHMGNYFITVNEQGSLMPVYIDTGCCVRRNASQIKKDIQFLSNYFVGNSKGLAEYFVSLCESADSEFLSKVKLIESSIDSKKQFVKSLAKDIQELIFDKKHNVTDVDAVQKTIQNIMEKYGLSITPEASTAMKAQMQFYTGITEAAALSGRTINAGTIVNDIPSALMHMLKAKFNPFPTITPALKFSYNNQEQAARIVTQFMTEPAETMQYLTTDLLYKARNTKFVGNSVFQMN